MKEIEPEHTPAPSPGRAVYGFCLYSSISTLFIIYVCWAFLPLTLLEDTLGLFYLPDKYFALYIPILLLCSVTVFAFFIYPSLSLLMTPDIDDQCTIRDKFTIYRCKFIDSAGHRCDNKVLNEFKSGWRVNEYCEFHKKFINYIMTGHLSDGEILEEEIITNMCDCPKSSSSSKSKKNICLLQENSDYVKILKNRQKVPTICDLDVSEICNRLFDT